MVSNISSSASNNSLINTLWSQLSKNDKDGDDKLTLAEIKTAATQSSTKTAGDADYAKAFAKIDINGDGFVTRDEFNNYLQSSNPDKTVMSGLISDEVSQAINELKQQFMQAMMSTNSTTEETATSSSLASQLQMLKFSSNDLFNQLDTDQNNQISEYDFSSIGKSLLSQLQTYNSALSSNTNLESTLNNILG